MTEKASGQGVERAIELIDQLTDAMVVYAIEGRGTAAGAIQLRSELRAHLSELAAPQWIPVAERLPEEGTPVLVWVPQFLIPFVGYVNHEYEPPWLIALDVEHLTDEQPTHWKALSPSPLPADPPR